MGHSFTISDSARAFHAAADISIMGIKGHRQTDTEISIYGHKMDADRQANRWSIRVLERSPYMGINGHTQTDGQNGSYDNRYNGVCIKG